MSCILCIVSCDFSTLQGSRRPVSKGHLHPSYHLFAQTHILGHWKYHNAVCPWRHEQQRAPHITTSTSSTQRIVKPAKTHPQTISRFNKTGYLQNEDASSTVPSSPTSMILVTPSCINTMYFWCFPPRISFLVKKKTQRMLHPNDQCTKMVPRLKLGFPLCKSS